MGHGRIVEASEWNEMYVPDVYFSIGYHQASSVIERDFSKILLIEWKDESGGIYLPLIIRKIPNTSYFDATSAYGYGGPWVTGQPKVADFMDFFNEWAGKNSIICTFLRFHPILNNAAYFTGTIPIKVIGPTAAWDLSRGSDLLSGMAKDHRKTYRRAIRSGIEVRLSVNPTNFTDFTHLYQTSMNRLSADDFYHFSDVYWESFRNSLGDQSLLVEAIFEDRVVAGVWCMFGDNYFHYHLSGTSDEGRKLGGAVVCRLAAAEWAQELGLSIAHSGGGAGGADSPLLSWKMKFDKESPLLEFSVANLIHDKSIYEKIANNYVEQGYFPPWRNPKAQTSADH